MKDYTIQCTYLRLHPHLRRGPCLGSSRHYLLVSKLLNIPLIVSVSLQWIVGWFIVYITHYLMCLQDAGYLPCCFD